MIRKDTPLHIPPNMTIGLGPCLSTIFPATAAVSHGITFSGIKAQPILSGDQLHTSRI